MTRNILITALAAASVAAFAPLAMAQFTVGPGTFGAPDGAARMNTVKSSKSNSSDRMGGGGGGKGGAAKATNLNSSRSNTP